MTQNTNLPADNDETPLDVAAMAQLMESQQRSTRRAVNAATNWIILAWGVAWTIGFTAMWSSDTVGGNPWFRLPDAVAAWTFALLLAAAAIASAVLGVLSGRGQRGDQNTAGMMYGFAFAGSMMTAGFVGSGLQRAGVSSDAVMLMWPAMFCFGVGVAYVAGAGIWRSWGQFAMGAIFLLACVIATWIGTPHHSLAYAICGVVMMTASVLVQFGVISLNGRDRSGR